MLVRFHHLTFDVQLCTVAGQQAFAIAPSTDNLAALLRHGFQLVHLVAPRTVQCRCRWNKITVNGPPCHHMQIMALAARANNALRQMQTK